MTGCCALVAKASWDPGNPIFELRPKAPPLSRREKAPAGSSTHRHWDQELEDRKTDCCYLLQVSPRPGADLYLEVPPGQTLLSLRPAHQHLLAFYPHSQLHPGASLGHLVEGGNWVLGPTSKDT